MCTNVPGVQARRRFFLFAKGISENWLFIRYWKKISKNIRYEVIRLFQIFQKVFAVHYSIEEFGAVKFVTSKIKVCL